MRRKNIAVVGMLLVTCLSSVGCGQKKDKQESLAATKTSAFETASEKQTEEKTEKETIKETSKETVKETAKAAAPKAEAKKPAARRTAAKKAEATAEVYFQYLGKEFASKDLVSDVKKAWIEMTGKKEEDIQDVKVYVKPEENKAYYVVNGEAEGNYIEL